ncbi:MAG: zf-TFIIB domain-containing protein [bacterium]|nr:zf-TFIIB domain-containing protein [bacterium]
MSNCVNCAAPLPPNSIVCPYCKTRNDVDLKGIAETRVEKPETERICPRCDQPLQTIDLKMEGKFLIERCKECMGLFFDPGELETIMDKSVDGVYNIDSSRIEGLIKMRRHQEYPVAYIKCPVCRKLMNRVNFGTRSGVIVDTCKEHGMWLDGGELRQLMQWMKAGGQILHHKSQLEEERAKRQKAERKLRETAAVDIMQPVGSHGHGGFGSRAGSFDGDLDLLTIVTRTVSWLFR